MNLENKKLYIVVREDLKDGLKMSQSLHAVIDFQLKYPEIVKEWREQSDIICSLVATKEELNNLITKIKSKQEVYFVEFFEPDLNNELTAIAVGFGSSIKKLMFNLKPSFSN